jgi:hypothetical protein
MTPSCALTLMGFHLRPSTVAIPLERTEESSEDRMAAQNRFVLLFKEHRLSMI